MLWPRLGHIGLMEFSSAAEAIQEGRDAVDRLLEQVSPEKMAAVKSSSAVAGRSATP